MTIRLYSFITGKIGFPLWFLMFSPFVLLAQLEEAASHLSEGNCDAAIAVYESLQDNPRLQAMAQLGLSEVYSTSSCVQYDLEKAYVLLVQLDEWYRSLETKEKQRQKRKGYNTSQFNRTRKRVIDSLFQQALATGEPVEIDKFIAQRSALLRRSQKSEIAHQRNQLLIRQITNKVSVIDLQEMESQYGASFRADSYQLLDSLYHVELTAWVQEKGWEDWVEMLKIFPDNTFAKDRVRDDFLAIRESSNPKRFLQFADRNRNSKWKKIAQDSAMAIQERAQQLRLQAERVFLTLQDSTAHNAWPAADEQLKKWIIGGFLQQSSAEKFVKTLPGERVPLSQDFFRDYYVRRNGELKGLLLTQRQFNQYYNPDSLQARIDTLQLEVIARRRAELDQKLVTLADDKQSYNWKSSDRELSRQITNLAEEDMEYALNKIKELPPKRIIQTLAVLLSAHQSNDSIDGEKLFFATFPKADKPVVIEEIYKRQQQEQQYIFTRLQKKISPALRERKWSAAAKMMETEATQLGTYQPYLQLIDILTRDEADEAIRLLGGAAVNTEISEYTPVLTADGQRLYFCRFNFVKEDIHMAEKVDSIWYGRGELARFADETLNVAPLSLTVDGNRMLIFKGGTLMYTDRMADGWSEAIAYPSTINGGSWQGMGALSSDGSVLIFETRGQEDMAGGLYADNTDLYISFLSVKGKWSKAQSLSKIINTPQVERSPYIHPDMRTLYFSTNARGGLGGLDVFKTTRLDDSWLNWSEPIHLGRNANTTGDDWGYKISTDGSFAYFAADPDDDEIEDIYQVNLPPEARPEPVSLITAQLLQADSTPIEGELLVEDLDSGEIVARLRTEPLTGRVTTALPKGKYALVFENGDRLPFADNLDLSDLNESQQVSKKIVLKTISEKLEDNEAITLRNIFFDHDQASLKTTSNAELNRITDLLSTEQSLSILIKGHTDNAGDEGYNLKLSQQRAQAVRQALIRRGIAAERMIAQGMGESTPIAPNETEAGRAKNRRVELFLQEK